MKISILGGRLIDPENGIDQLTNVHIAAGKVVALGDAPEGFEPGHTIDASEQIVCPGLVDLRACLREPGQEYKATISSETRAAASAGITTIVCPPDTDPVTDTPAVLDRIQHRASQAGYARVLPLGALTKNLQGKQLSEMGALKAAGCVGVSNAHHAIENAEVMRRAMEYAASQDLPVFLHAEEPSLANGGCAHEGAVSVRLGLPGIPDIAESVAVARELQLIEQTGVRAHFCQLSSARAVKMIARAKHDGLPISADVAVHQLFLTEMDIAYFDSQCHVRPPLRTQRDCDSLREALQAGVISAVCSDHQPHDTDAKLAPFPSSESGISSLETLLPLALRLEEEGVVTLSQAIARITQQPAKIVGATSGFSEGACADVCIFDPQQYWQLTPDTMVSHGHNSPFLGWEFKGKVTHTLLAGRVVFESDPKA